MTNSTEIFELGRHRLMCADACEAANVEKLIAGYKVDLILTDPPYGMKIQKTDNSQFKAKRVPRR